MFSSELAWRHCVVEDRLSIWCVRRNLRWLRIASNKSTKREKKTAVIRSSSDEISGGSDEEVFARLLSLDWCKIFSNCGTTLSHSWECLCCREVPEASALADFNRELITCITKNHPHKRFDARYGFVSYWISKWVRLYSFLAPMWFIKICICILMKCTSCYL